VAAISFLGQISDSNAPKRYLITSRPAYRRDLIVLTGASMTAAISSKVKSWKNLSSSTALCRAEGIAALPVPALPFLAEDLALVRFLQGQPARDTFLGPICVQRKVDSLRSTPQS